MEASTYREIQGPSRLTVGPLRKKYLDVFGEEARARHKEFLCKCIAWRLQALAEGGLSERARRRRSEAAGAPRSDQARHSGCQGANDER